MSLGGDETEAGWESTLEQAPQVVLRAPEGRPWSEVWQLRCSPIWSCAATGLPPVSRLAEGVFAPEYRPWPGESITVRLAHPQGVEGQTLTIDDVSLEATPGRRLERVRLAATARSSREQPLVLRIPQEAEVQQVTIDGQDRPARPEKGELRVTVPAGRHTRRGPLAAVPRHGRLLRPAARVLLEPRGQRHAAAHPAARALAPRHARPRLGPGRPLLALSRVPARRGPRASAASPRARSRARSGSSSASASASCRRWRPWSSPPSSSPSPCAGGGHRRTPGPSTPSSSSSPGGRS